MALSSSAWAVAPSQMRELKQRMPVSYTHLEEQIAEVSASMAMEQMPLDTNDINLLKKYQESGDKDNIRKQLLENYKES